MLEYNVCTVVPMSVLVAQIITECRTLSINHDRIAAVSQSTNRVRTILVLGYWVLGNIHRYWVVSLLGDIFCCSDTQYIISQTAVSTIHMPVNDYLVPLVTCAVH